MSDIDLKELRARTERFAEDDEREDLDHEKWGETMTPWHVLQLLTRLERAERERDEAVSYRDSYLQHWKNALTQVEESESLAISYGEVRRELDQAWDATGVAGCVRGLGGTELSDVVERLKEDRDEARTQRDAAVAERDGLARERTVLVEQLSRVEEINDVLERHFGEVRSALSQCDKDWAALLKLIAQTVGTPEDKEAAEMDELDEFDPWHALRTHQARAARGSKEE